MVLALAAIVMIPQQGSSHEIPRDITIRTIIKADGQFLRVLMRLPLRAMRDIEFPVEGPGYLVLDGIDPILREAVERWVGSSVVMYENDVIIPTYSITAVRVSIPSNRSFGSYETAAAHLADAPLSSDVQLHWQNAMLDMMLEYPIASAASRFTIAPNLERLALRVLTVMRFVGPDGSERVFQYVGSPGLVRLDPSWLQATLTFTRLGFLHILDGFDHLLFLLCLVIPFRRVRGLVPIVTAFTVGHSITLIGSAMRVTPNALWFPALVETLIAVSIVYMALENIVGAKLQRRWMIAFGFGLVHGFGFSFALGETLQFAGSHLLGSLLAFNVGVELGQLLVVLLMIPALELLFRFGVKERMGTIILSAIVAHTGWHWMVDRGTVLAQYRVQWLGLGASLLMGLRWLLLAGLVAAGAWILVRVYRSMSGPRFGPGETVGTTPP